MYNMVLKLSRNSNLKTVYTKTSRSDGRKGCNKAGKYPSFENIRLLKLLD